MTQSHGTHPATYCSGPFSLIIQHDLEFSFVPLGFSLPLLLEVPHERLRLVHQNVPGRNTVFEPTAISIYICDHH